MTTRLRLRKFWLPALLLVVSGWLPGCAHDPDKNKPWHRQERKWYQGDMDSEDRAFFLDSFFHR